MGQEDSFLVSSTSMKVSAIAISNVSLKELDSYRRAGEVDSNQFRYSMLSRGVGHEQAPFCTKYDISGIA